MNPRDYLIYLSLKFSGDYRMVREAIQKREENFDDVELPPMNCKALTILDEEYPETLKEFPQCPIVLFYYGDISLLKNFDRNLAVVGARDCSDYGLAMTNEIVNSIAEEVNIVSGLARGVDSTAQIQAIKSGGRVIGVLGSGIDVCYPPQNKRLYDHLKKNHLLISEYPGITEPSPDKFPFRNRLIAMISSTIFIPEATKRSGTSITAFFAKEFNKNICCIPHRVGSDSLCNYLIANGCYLVEKGDDILEVMNIQKEITIFDL